MDKSKNLPTYLSMPVSKLAEKKVKSVMGGRMGYDCEELTLRLRLVSSKKTQIKELHELINWRQTDQLAGARPPSCSSSAPLQVGRPREDAAGGARRAHHAAQHQAQRRRPALPAAEALPVFGLFSHILAEFCEAPNRARGPLLEDYIGKQVPY